MGIVYQSASEETSRAAANALQNRPSASGDSTSQRKRKRTFESFGVDIEPYHKKPKISSVDLMLLGYTDQQRILESYRLAKVNNLLWMIQFSILPKSTAMWVGLMHSIELTRKRQKWYGMFRLSINHQHRQQLLKKQWKVHNKWPLNVENVKLLWPTI